MLRPLLHGSLQKRRRPPRVLDAVQHQLLRAPAVHPQGAQLLALAVQAEVGDPGQGHALQAGLEEAAGHQQPAPCQSTCEEASQAQNADEASVAWYQPPRSISQTPRLSPGAVTSDIDASMAGPPQES